MCIYKDQDININITINIDINIYIYIYIDRHIYIYIYIYIDIPIVYIAVPFLGLTKSILRILKGSLYRNYNGDYRVCVYIYMYIYIHIHTRHSDSFLSPFSVSITSSGSIYSFFLL